MRRMRRERPFARPPSNRWSRPTADLHHHASGWSVGCEADIHTGLLHVGAHRSRDGAESPWIVPVEPLICAYSPLRGNRRLSQFVEQRPGLFEVGGVEAFGEPAEDWGEEGRAWCCSAKSPAETPPCPDGAYSVLLSAASMPRPTPRR